MIDTLTDCDRS